MCTAAPLSFAQTPPPEDPQGKPTPVQSDKPGADRFWRAKLPGGEYIVQVDRIGSLSRHSYLLDGAVIVDEVTIDVLGGQSLVRFYQLSPVSDAIKGSATGNAVASAVDRAQTLTESTASRFGANVHEMVVKKYPDTTHARTIEYRIQTTAQLTQLYNSIKTAWESNRGRSFTLK